MKPLDRYIQKLRVLKAGRYIPSGSRLLDIGCADGVIFRHLSHKIRLGMGIDPGIEQGYTTGAYTLIRGVFPENLPPGDPGFDVITLLAVLEHIHPAEQVVLAADIFNHLRPGGRLIITVPSPFVDRILEILKKLGWIDGMSLEEHYGFDVRTVRDTFTKSGLRFIRHEYFQLGLNNLFVFEKD